VIKFDLVEERDMIIGGGLWMLFSHYLAIVKWNPSFNSATIKVDRTMVHIRVPNLNLLFYDESLLLAIDAAVGQLVEVDKNTLKVECGRFARACVEIDLNLCGGKSAN
jgi:hypothetical protein